MNLDDEILNLEKRFWTSMIEKDAEAGGKLTADPCIVAGAQGVARIDRSSFVKMIEGAAWDLHSFEFTDVKVERVADDVAVIAYKVREVISVDGKKMTLDAADTSTWVRASDGWKCALHTESVLGDPFGRDRIKRTKDATA